MFLSMLCSCRMTMSVPGMTLKVLMKVSLVLNFCILILLMCPVSNVHIIKLECIHIYIKSKHTIKMVLFWRKFRK